jgi:undecaprenyl-diphosphatase
MAPNEKQLRTRQVFLRVGMCFGIFLLLLLIPYALSFAISDTFDRELLAAINPDTRIVFLDELMVAITDFSMMLFGIGLVFWEIGYVISTHRPDGVKKAEKLLRLIGLSIGVVFVFGFWVFGYELKWIFPVLGPIVSVVFWLLSNTYATVDPKFQNMIQNVVFVTLIAALLSVTGEGIIKAIVARPRPLNPENDSWNFILRRFPDEIVYGFSYYSGHSSGLFAAVTPLALASPKSKWRLTLWIWAGVHAFSRIYVAAHFPYCCLVGSMMGFLAGYVAFSVQTRPMK